MTNKYFLTFRNVHVESHISTGIRLEGCEVSADDTIQHFLSTFTVKPYTKIKRVHNAKCIRRGHYILESAKIEYAGEDIFIDSKFEFNIYPEETPVDKQESLNMYLQYSNYSRYPIIEDVFSVNGIRAYNYGDAFATINHKATAKMGELMVNTKDHVLGRQVMVYINFQMLEENYMSLSQYESLMERALSYAAYIIGECERYGFKFGFACNSRFSYGGRSTRYPMSSGYEAYLDVMKILACVRTAEGDSILPCLDKDIDENMTNTEVYFFTLRMDDAVDGRLNIIENMGNAVTVLKIDEV